MSSQYVDSPENSEKNLLEAVAASKFRLVKLLGRGSYGAVFEGIALQNNDLHIEAGTRVAIKVVRNVLSGYGAINAKRMLREICILRNMDHPNIMKFRGLLAPVNINALKDLYIVCDYVVTDLHKILHSDQAISNKHVQYITYQMLKSVRYLHERDIIHRDIKPANMLIDERVSLKLCDFGLARSTSVKPRLQSLVNKAKGPKMQQQHVFGVENAPNKSLPLYQSVTSVPNGVAGLVEKPKPVATSNAAEPYLEKPELKREYTLHVTTRWYRAPELILESRDYTGAIDIWSIGCILAELIAMQLNSNHRNALFPGDSCLPFSPIQKRVDNVEQPRSINDQMKAILDVIGTPSLEEVKKCYPDTWQEAWQYITSFGIKKRIHYSERYKGADDLALQLLHQLLEFDPAKRLSARQALQHPYLKGIVDELNEHEDVYGSTSKCRDKDGNVLPNPYFDFEEHPINVAMAQALLVEQVLIDNRHRCKDYIVTREFQKVMETRESRIRDELMELGKQKGVDLSLVHVLDMHDVDQNTEQINSFIKQLKNCNRYSFVLFPPHQFRSIAVDVKPETEIQKDIEYEDEQDAAEEPETTDWERSASDDMNDVTLYESHVAPTQQNGQQINNVFDINNIPDVPNMPAPSIPRASITTVASKPTDDGRPPVVRTTSRSVAVPIESNKKTTWSDLTQEKISQSPVYRAALSSVTPPAMNLTDVRSHALPPLPTRAKPTQGANSALPPVYQNPNTTKERLGPPPRFPTDSDNQKFVNRLINNNTGIPYK